MADTLGIGFVGGGMVAELHQQAIVASEAGRLIGLYEQSAARSAQRATAWGITAYASLAALLADPAIDAVFVLTPVETHREIALAALTAGKHVLIEKPVADSVADIQTIAEAARAAGRVAMPGHNYLYQPDLWRARRLIQGGALGRICASWITYVIAHPEEVAAHYHGVLREVVVHHFSLLLYLVGAPTHVWATTQTLHYAHLTQDDQASVVAQMPDGSISHLFATFAVDDPTTTPWTFLVKILGTQGGISYSWRDAIFQRPLGTLGYAIAPYEESYRYEVEHFLTQCIGRGLPPLSTLADAATIHRLIEQAEASHASGNAMSVLAEGA